MTSQLILNARHQVESASVTDNWFTRIHINQDRILVMTSKGFVNSVILRS